MDRQTGASGDGVAGKIFINYRREDARAEAARLRDRLADAFGAANVFMDVDNLLPGERFDLKLQEALAETDVFLAVIGARWSELLAARTDSGERDYVREEIAAALARKIAVVPVLVDRAPMPRAAGLPGDIRDLVLYQKHDVAHESFGRDAAALADAIKAVRRARSKPIAAPWKPFAALALVAAGALAYVLAPAKGPDPAPTPVVEPPKPAPAPSTPARREAAAEAPPARCDGLLVSVATGARPCIKPGSGESFKDCPDCPEMVIAPSGSFTMGSPKDEPQRESWKAGTESPQHDVKIAKPFAVSRYHITRGEWARFVKVTGHKTDGGCWTWTGGKWEENKSASWRSPGFEQDDDHPVVCVNWEDAKAYAGWLSKQTGKSYRLLSEAEYEYAARARTATPFWWGSSITPEQANYDGNYVYAGGGSKGAYRAKTVPVKSFKPNPWGLYQVHGNAWSWVEDCWHDNYDGAPSDGSAWTSGDCTYRVLRGGSWNINPQILRAAYRYSINPQGRGTDRGFRVALGWQDLNR
jgi:formylglycine-generating enzyme required for sulfatase activity